RSRGAGRSAVAAFFRWHMSWLARPVAVGVALALTAATARAQTSSGLLSPPPVRVSTNTTPPAAVPAATAPIVTTPVATTPPAAIPAVPAAATPLAATTTTTPVADATTKPASSPAPLKVTKGQGILPNEHGQVWREYDISPYTLRVRDVTKPEQ